MIVRREDLGESIPHLQFAVEPNTFWNRAIKCHEETRISIIVLCHWRVVEMGESSFIHCIINLLVISRTPQSESLAAL